MQFANALVPPSLQPNHRRILSSQTISTSSCSSATITPSSLAATNGRTRLGVQSTWMTIDSSSTTTGDGDDNGGRRNVNSRPSAADGGTSSRGSAFGRSKPIITTTPSTTRGSTKKSPGSNNTNNSDNNDRSKKRKYNRKLPPPTTESLARQTRRRRQAAYEKMRSSSLSNNNAPPSIWSFDSLFAAPVLDEDTFNAALSAGVPLPPRPDQGGAASATPPASKSEPKTVDKALTRMVEDRIYGYTRSPAGSIQYTASMLDSSRAVQFREGRRLGKALSINIDRLCYFAKKDLRHGKLEEAQEYYMKALEMDPSDGRPYLGLSRIAERRGDLEYAKGMLRQGIARSGVGFVTVRGPAEGGSGKKSKKNKDGEKEEGKDIGTIPDNGPNPFLLQALGTLEQRSGHLAHAEELYLQALRSRPSHAAAWVALAQLRTKELRQSAEAGRICYQSAENELRRIGAKPNAFVYTAWASMEYKKGIKDDAQGIRRARELYELALEADPRCSVAFLQLGVMESECGNFDRAKECFEKVLTFDQRNSRVLQAYAIMESRRPREDVDSRRVLDLFERALQANPRDAGVYQAYALYVVDLGDVDSARDLLRRGTEVDKRHAPVWQAWGVLETRYSTAKAARDVFQQGIWACAQPGGGQSGGRRCARLWQAWGVMEAQEGDHSAARRCFSRALDADQRNVAAVTAWTMMEADLGYLVDARSIFERTLKLFPSPSDDKMAIWRAWEIMEEQSGNTRAAQLVFQRSMRDSMSSREEALIPSNANVDVLTATADIKSLLNGKKEIEVSRWMTESNDFDAEVWMNNGSIEGKLPPSIMKKLRNGDTNKR
eukprot:g13855.t1 g13855   contig9:603479-606348(-)